MSLPSYCTSAVSFGYPLMFRGVSAGSGGALQCPVVPDGHTLVSGGVPAVPGGVLAGLLQCPTMFQR